MVLEQKINSLTKNEPKVTDSIKGDQVVVV
jgi:hypothetical protein